MDITYRFLDPGSESDISQWLDLHSVCFQYKITRYLWDHIYMANPFYKKTKPLILIAEVDTKMVGSLSLLPSPIQEHRRNSTISYPSLLMCKGMVHPDYQKRGVFNHLSKNILDIAESEGYDSVLGFSNSPFSYQSLTRTGFQDLAAMRWSKTYLSIDTTVSKYVDTIRLPQIVKKIIVPLFSRFYSLLTPHVKHSYQLQYGNIYEFIEQITEFTNSTNPNGGIFGIRTNNFIRWRFFRDDACFKCLTLMDDGRMLGYLILQYKEGDKDAFIIDMWLSNNDKFLISILMSEIRQYLKKNNFQKLWVYIVENDSNLSTFFSLRNGFFIRSPKAGKSNKSRFLRYTLNKNLANPSLLDKKNWNIQSSDTCWFLA
jgi:predicted N-acetyltransferase YhbS